MRVGVYSVQMASGGGLDQVGVGLAPRGDVADAVVGGVEAEEGGDDVVCHAVLTLLDYRCSVGRAAVSSPGLDCGPTREEERCQERPWPSVPCRGD